MSTHAFVVGRVVARAFHGSQLILRVEKKGMSTRPDQGSLGDPSCDNDVVGVTLSDRHVAAGPGKARKSLLSRSNYGADLAWKSRASTSL